MFFDGYDLYVAGGVLASAVQTKFSTLPQNLQFLSLTFVGMTLGSLITGFVGDKMGRRFTYQINLLVFGLASLAAAFYVTSPPSETAPDLADFHQRQGHAPRFAGKGREMAPGLRRMGRYEGRSDGRLRASSQGVEGRNLPPTGRAMTPPQKNKTPSGPPPDVFQRRCRSRASNRA